MNGSDEHPGEKMELSHKAVEGFPKAFYITLTIIGLYLLGVFIWAGFAGGGHP